MDVWGGGGGANVRSLPRRTFVFSLQHQRQSDSQSCSIRSSAQQVHDLRNTTGHKSDDVDHRPFLWLFFPNMTCIFWGGDTFFEWSLHQKNFNGSLWKKGTIWDVKIFVFRSAESSVLGVIAFTCQIDLSFTFEMDVEHTYRMYSSAQVVAF